MCRPSVSKANLGTMSPINGSSLSSEIQTICRCLVSNSFRGYQQIGQGIEEWTK